MSLEKCENNNTKRININLDIVRVLAAVMVLSVHIGQRAGFDFGVGAQGVSLFFILSGYLAFSSGGGNWKAYYIKRAKRILPTYYACLACVYLYDLLFNLIFNPYVNPFEGQCGIQFLRYVFLAQLILPSDNWNMWNNHNALWTMSSFAVFYLLVPFLYKICNKFWKAFLLLSFFLVFTPQIVIMIERLLILYPQEAHIEWFANSNPLARLYCFLLGTVLYVARKEGKEGIYGFAISLVLIVTKFSWYPYEFAFTLMVLVAASFHPVFYNEKITGLLRVMSKGSFTLYLIHPVVLQGVSVIWGIMGFRLNGVLYAGSLYGLSVFFAGVMYLGINFCEKKVCNFLNMGKA